MYCRDSWHGKVRKSRECQMPFDARSFKAIRKRLGLSQYQLAVKLGCTPQTVHNWESMRSVPRIGALDRIHLLCTRLGLTDTPSLWVPPNNSNKE